MAKEKSEKDAKGKDAKHDKGGKPGGKPPAADAKPAAKPAKDAKKEGKAAKPTAKGAAPTQPPRLQAQYRETIVPALMKQCGYKTRLPAPRGGPRLRQPRQLQHGHQGTDHFSGDRLRQDRRAPGLEYLHHHHREDRRGSEGAPRRVPVSVQN